MIRTFKYRLYPTKAQVQLINDQLFEACKLYNVALEQRIMAYRSAKKYISYYDQAREVKYLRAEGLCKIINANSAYEVLIKLDNTFKAFRDRIKRGQKPGFPRFKPASRYNTLTYQQYGNGCKIRGNKFYLQGIGEVCAKFHRPVVGGIKMLQITRRNNKFYASFACYTEISPLPKTNNSLGIDMGLESFAVTSEGEFIENPRYYRTAQRKLRVLNRSVSRKHKGSVSRKKAVHLLAKQHEKIANQRADFAHKLSRKIINENDIICIEDLNIQGLAGGMLAKSINDVAWGIFFNFLIYKAESAGREVIKVDPRGTSQRCCQCGTVVKKDLSVRHHHCPVCGLSVHRDLNSAKEILRLGTDLSPLTWNTGSCVGLEAD